MKKVYHFTDTGGVKFDVGYGMWLHEPLFYIETSLPHTLGYHECVTLHVTPVQLRKLISKMEKLCVIMTGT